MVIAAGSYPAGRWFESDRRYQNRPHGQAVKTSPFHGGNPSSSLGGVTTITQPLRGAVVFVLGALPALGLRSFGRTAGSRTRPPTRVGENGDLAQLVRALALQARGQRFKSASLHQKRTKSNPILFAFSLTPRTLGAVRLPHGVRRNRCLRQR